MLPVAVLAGGLATRMRPATETIPKAMLEVAGKPFIDHQLRLLAGHGVTRVILCTGYLRGQIEEFVGHGARYGLSVSYSTDWPELLGTGGALKNALPLLGPEFLVLYGDSYLEIDYADVAESFLSSQAEALMTVYENAGQFDVSNVLLNEGRIALYSKKDTLPQMRHIDYGLLGMTAAPLLQSASTAFDLSELLEELSRNNQLAAYVAKKRFFEIGSPAGLNELERHLGSFA